MPRSYAKPLAPASAPPIASRRDKVNEQSPLLLPRDIAYVIKQLLLACSSMALIAATPPFPPAQRVTAKRVVATAIAKINANDAAGLAALFTDDPTIIDDVPPFRWTGSTAVAEWLSE